MNPLSVSVTQILKRTSGVCANRDPENKIPAILKPKNTQLVNRRTMSFASNDCMAASSR